MKKALITGVFGQDGAYLAKSLLLSGYRVFGGDLSVSRRCFVNLEYLKADKDVEASRLDLTDQSSVQRILGRTKPDEIYNLAGQSSVGLSFKKPGLTKSINALGVRNLLTAAERACPEAKIFQASSAEIYAGAGKGKIGESEIPNPISPYGESKLLAQKYVELFRKERGSFACSGILFNHESPLRGTGFVTRKISRAAAAISLGLQENLVLGNISAKRDWGYAGDYVEAMRLMLCQDSPSDYVIATGKSNSVRDFVDAAFAYTGEKLDWKGRGVKEIGVSRRSGKILVKISAEFYRPADTGALIGNPGKAKRTLGWAPETGFEEMVGLMVEADLKRLKAGKK